MAKQSLQRVEIDIGFEHVSREGMTKEMDSAWLFDFSELLCLCECMFERGSAEVASSIPRREKKVARLLATEVPPKLFEEARREKRQSILRPFALFDTDHHAIRVDVGESELDDFADAQAGRVGDEEEHPVLQGERAGQQTSDLVTAQYVRQLLRCAGDRDVEIGPRSSEGSVIEEAKCSGLYVAGADRSFLVLMEMKKIGPDVGVRDPVRGSSIVLSQLRDRLQVSALCAGSQTPKGHLLDHLIAKLRHGGTSLAMHRHGLVGARNGAPGGQDDGVAGTLRAQRWALA